MVRAINSPGGKSEAPIAAQDEYLTPCPAKIGRLKRRRGQRGNRESIEGIGYILSIDRL